MLVKLKLKVWKKLINKLRYFRNECKKKDKIIQALEEQLEVIRGISLWFIPINWIHIIPKDKDKIGILKHELKHFYRTFFTHFIMYKFSKKYRYRAELEAYAEQIKYYKYTSLDQANWIVNSLMYGYNLNMDINTIKSDVFKIIKRLTPQSQMI